MALSFHTVAGQAIDPGNYVVDLIHYYMIRHQQDTFFYEKLPFCLSSIFLALPEIELEIFSTFLIFC